MPKKKTTKKKKRSTRLRGFACDSWWLRREMQDQGLSVRKLLERCNECMSELAMQHSSFHADDKIEDSRIHELLREDGRFDEDIFIIVAAGLGLDDHLCLTRRNRLAYRLETSDEKNVLMGVQKLIISRTVLSPEVLDGLSCLLNFLHDLKDKWPYEFGRVVLDYPRLRNVCEALCPAGQCIKKGGLFLITRPSTGEMLKRAKTRLRRLHEAIDDLFDPEYGREDRFEYRRSVGQLIKEHGAELKKRQDAADYDDGCYVDADIDWQIELFSGGDAVLYQEMLNLLPVCRHTHTFLISQHERQPALPFDEDFALPFEQWRSKWNELNTELVQELARSLLDRNALPDDLKVIIRDIVEHTILNIKAVDNALERHRKNSRRNLTYPNLKWDVDATRDE